MMRHILAAFSLMVGIVLGTESHGQDLRQFEVEIQDVIQEGTFLPSVSPRLRVLDTNLGAVHYGWSVGNPNTQLIDYLARDNVRKQLEFTEEQTKEFKSIQSDFGKAYRDLYAQYPELKKKDLPKEARKELNRKVQLAGKKMRQEFSEKIKETLVPHQVSMIETLRFKQSVQIYGFTHTVTNSPFSDQLKTTDKQKKEIQQIRKKTLEAIQKVVEEMKAEGKADMLKVLDAKQRKKLKEIEGEKKEGVKNLNL